MDTLTRRKLLARAAAAGVGATVIGKFASTATADSPVSTPSGDPSVIDPNFIAGQVVETSAGFVVIRDPDSVLAEFVWDRDRRFGVRELRLRAYSV
jgi:hypothetical protein